MSQRLRDDIYERIDAQIEQRWIPEELKQHTDDGIDLVKTNA